MRDDDFRLPNGRPVHGINRNETEYLYQEIFEDRVYLHPCGLDLADDPVILDVGANIGLFSLFAVDRWPTATVHAFEPVPQVFAALERNTADAAQVRRHRLAIGAHAHRAELTYYPRYTMMSGFHARADADEQLVRAYLANVAETLEDDYREAVLDTMDEMLEGRFEQAVVECEVDTLPGVARREGLGRIDLLKVDVEGAELDVLRGMDAETWSLVRNAVVEVASAGEELAEAEKLFAANGFTTTVAQQREYRGTTLHLLYARR